MPKINKQIAKLREKGYPVKNLLEILSNDNDTNTIVYTSKEFQPCAETFSDKYCFIYNAIADMHIDEKDFTPDMLGSEIRVLNHELGIPGSLSEVGVESDKFDVMADDAMKSGNILVNPRKTTKSDILDLYNQAF